MNKDLNTGNIIIRKSMAVMFLRLIAIEVLLGLIYLLLRYVFILSDIHLETTFALNTLSLIKPIIFSIIEIGLSGFVFLHWVNNYYALNAHELIYFNGIIIKKEVSYAIKNVQTVSFEQGIVGRLFKFGSVKIFSPALQHELFLTEVPNPHKIVDLVNDVYVLNQAGSQVLFRR
jgi:uncharacterized membrane protein YdbT with pleckstrin-like domain